MKFRIIEPSMNRGYCGDGEFFNSVFDLIDFYRDPNHTLQGGQIISRETGNVPSTLSNDDFYHSLESERDDVKNRLDSVIQFTQARMNNKV